MPFTFVFCWFSNFWCKATRCSDVDYSKKMHRSAAYTTACPVQSVGTYQMLFNQLILSLLNATCDLRPPYPKDSVNVCDSNSAKTFDFIVIGAGSSGSVIASRLSEIPYWNILLIEAGEDPPIEEKIPGLLSALEYSATAYEIFADKNPKYCQGQINEECFLPHAKMMGGCSSHNAMKYVRGNSRDFDYWASIGNDGWDYASLQPYFKKLENMLVPHLRRNGNHGTRGYQDVDYFKNETIRAPVINIERSIRGAALEVGLRHVDDLGTITVAGFGNLLGTIKDSVRENAAEAYLSPVRCRPNLHVMKGGYVKKLLIDKRKRKVYGVTVHKNKADVNITVCKEVIVSAGALNSPQILMLSGIGPKEHLEAMKLSVVKDLPVGYCMQDHWSFLGSYFTAGKPQPDHPNDALQQRTDALYNYLTKRTAELGSPDGSTLIFYNSTETTSDYPDLQFVFRVVNGKPSALKQYFDTYRYLLLKPEIIDAITKIKCEYLVFLHVYILRPSIWGRIYLGSTNASVPVRVDMDYPKDEERYRGQLKTLLAAKKFLENLGKTKSFRCNDMHGPYVFNVSNCGDSWECVFRYMATTSYHQVGTCRMGPEHDPSAVVDSTLKVHGVEGVRVADASIMSRITTGNTNVACLMLAEKAADIIKSEWLKNTNEGYCKKEMNTYK